MPHLDRREAPQNIAWFRDLHNRGLLNLDPPYQRRSVWNQAYKDYFVDTVLLDYPAPPIFLHEEMSADGVATYSVVDGKQRLTTVLEFADDLFPVSDRSVLERHQGRFFSQLNEATRTAFWTYKFAVEFLPITDEGVLNDIFDRLNRNVARLTRQELRRARFSGLFATSAEEASDVLFGTLPSGFPRIAAASRRQMKDVEFSAQLLLLVESGASSFSQDELDDAYSARDEEWEDRLRVEKEYRAVVAAIEKLAAANGGALVSTRLRNQADFYSLFGAVMTLRREKELPDPDKGARALTRFAALVGNEDKRDRNARAKAYFEAARSASNDLRQRAARIGTIRELLAGAK